MPSTSDTIVGAPETRQFEHFDYTPEERKFVADWWNEFMLLWHTKNAPLDILGGRTLQSFWDDSVRDYAVIAQELEDPNDPVQQYVSSISRDKADVFIGNMVGQLLYPSVDAVTMEKKVDRVMSRVSRGLLEFCHRNDGYPSETGMNKNARYIHKMVVEGTVHILDEFNKEDFLVSSLVPNEEVFVPNFWEHDIQKQSHVVRAQLNVTWENAESLYGDLPNFKYVSPQFSDFWFVQRPEFKQIFQGIIRNRRVQVLHVWKDLTRAQLRKEKDAGRVPQNARKAKYYNCIINDIPMYPPDNLSPYKDGMFPISKGVFSLLAKSEFYWGNSLPNKIRYDKRWLDAWKTLLRYKGKLNMLPPMVSLNGNFVDEEIMLPGKVTPITEELQLKRIEGVADPISQADVMLLDMAEKEIDRGSISPAASGNMPTKRMTKSEVLVSDANSKKMLDMFTMQMAFLCQSRSFSILKKAFQFMPRAVVETLTISDQKLSDGLRGDLELVFKKLPKMDRAVEYGASESLYQTELAARKNKQPKDIVFIDPGYLQSLNLFLYADADTLFEDKDATKRMQIRQDMQVLLSRPDLWSGTEVARMFAQFNDYPDEILANPETTNVTPEQLPNYGMSRQHLPASSMQSDMSAMGVVGMS